MPTTPCLSQKCRKIVFLWTCIYVMDVENTSIYGAKTLTSWRHNVLRKLTRVSVNPLRVLLLIGQSNYVKQTECIRIINISFAFDARIILNTSMYMESEYCQHVLAKYKSWFFPNELKQSGIWLANWEKFHKIRCKNRAVFYRKNSRTGLLKVSCNTF